MRSHEHIINQLKIHKSGHLPSDIFLLTHGVLHLWLETGHISIVPKAEKSQALVCSGGTFIFVPGSSDSRHEASYICFIVREGAPFSKELKN